MNTPSVSVALCTFNGARFLRELLDSVAAQERLPDELVVCDDGSDDGTIEILDEFAGSASFPVRIYHNERNLGPTKNFEKAIGLCTCDLIALCDQDDAWMPKKLLRAVEAFEADAELGFSFSDAELIDEDGDLLGKRLWESVGFSGARREQAENGQLLKLLVLYTFVTGSTMAFRSDLRDLVLPIPDDWVHDAWIALVASFVRPYRMLEEPLMKYRIHSGQLIGVPENPDTGEIETAEVTPWTIWKLRLQQVADFRGAERYRANRRSHALVYEHGYLEVEERFGVAAKRYLEASGRGPHPDADRILSDLRDRAEHLRARGTLPRQRAKRVPIVLQELRSGRYRRYSAGVLSALLDLIY